MADFTDKAALGTSRVNPSSMVPGATGNAPQGGFRTQAGMSAQVTPTKQLQNRNFLPEGRVPEPGINPIAQVGNQATGRDYNVRDAAIARLQAQLAPQGRTRQAAQSDLPAQTQSMLPGRSESDQKKNRAYKKEDFQLLSDVFKTLSER